MSAIRTVGHADAVTCVFRKGVPPSLLPTQYTTVSVMNGTIRLEAANQTKVKVVSDHVIKNMCKYVFGRNVVKQKYSVGNVIIYIIFNKLKYLDRRRQISNNLHY